jgi:TfoX/Sxy family transcriptional regulator of competence genes
MTLNERLAERVRAEFSGVSNLEEKRMFGGIAFMVNGKLCVSVRDERMMCRVDPANHDYLIRMGGCHTVKMRGREYKGYVLVDEKALKSSGDIRRWVGLALEFNGRAKASRKSA